MRPNSNRESWVPRQKSRGCHWSARKSHKPPRLRTKIRVECCDADALLSKLPKKLPNRPGGNLIREDYTKVVLSDFDRMRLAYSSAANFNRRIVEERAGTQQLVAEVVLRDVRRQA